MHESDIEPRNRPASIDKRSDGRDEYWIAVTIPGPEDTPYPEPFDGGAVYLCRKLLKVTFDEAIGTTNITSSDSANEVFVYLLNKVGRYIPIGTQILIKKTNNRYFTSDGHSGPFLGKTDAAIDKGASGTVSVYLGDGIAKGMEADTGGNVTCYNRFADVDGTRWVHFAWVSGGLELTAAEC